MTPVCTLYSRTVQLSLLLIHFVHICVEFHFTVCCLSDVCQVKVVVIYFRQ